MNLNMEYRALKYQHAKDRYYALYEMIKDTIWAVVVYAENEEDILFSCIEWDYSDAIHKYNLVRHNPQEYL